MTGIIGIWTVSAADVSDTANLMLDSLKHRGSSRWLEHLNQDSSGVALGCTSHDEGFHEIARTRDTLTAFNGSFYERRPPPNARHVLHLVNRYSIPKSTRELTHDIGGFAGLIGRVPYICGFRDVNGLKPLYYMQSSDLTAFASERKALWRIGLKDPRPVPPGSAVLITAKGTKTFHTAKFSRPREKKITFQQASSTLNRLLSTSIRRITRRAGRVCVAFSGGLDSALTAAMAKKAGVEVEAISVGLTNSPETLTAEQLARKLGLKITLQTFSPDLVEEYVRRLLWLIEEPNMMKLSVAIPLHWAAMVAARRGNNVMLCGQGSDELYGGYNKYANTLRLKGRKALSDQLYNSVIESSTVNYERDDQATSIFPVELRTPFADPDLIKFSLTIPTIFKVKDENDLMRKWILRDVARRVGLPEEIVWRRKKAIQHGTGVEKAILKLAKNRGLKPEEYLTQTFQNVSTMESMP